MRPSGLIEEYTSPNTLNLGLVTTLLIAPFARPMRIIRWGMIESTAAFDFTSALSLQLNKRVTIGTDTGAIAAAFGVMAVTLADAFTTTEKGFYVNCPQGENLLLPGEQIKFEITDAATTGVGHPFVHYEPLAFQKTSAHLVPPELPDPDRLIHMTQV